MQNFHELLLTRRSIRKYTDEPISGEDVKTILEAGLMGFCGGVIGVPISYVVSYVINYMQAQQSSADMGYYVDPSLVSSGSSIIPLWLCVAAIVFSALVGFISGLYPSIRAMKLSALDAIKNE